MKALMFFVREPILGKVKTRIGNIIGHDKAVQIYNLLLRKTYESAAKTSIENKVLFYEGEGFPGWPEFRKIPQDKDLDLGVRILSAFREMEKEGIQQAVLFGSDIVDLRSDIIEEAFRSLEQISVVIGPSYDGGFYCIGFNFSYIRIEELEKVFLNKEWSHPQVFKDTLSDLSGKHKHLLPPLEDIDTPVQGLAYLEKYQDG